VTKFVPENDQESVENFYNTAIKVNDKNYWELNLKTK
jgi:hypothetical protein